MIYDGRMDFSEHVEFESRRTYYPELLNAQGNTVQGVICDVRLSVHYDTST